MDYKSAGVDISKAESLISKVKKAAKSTYDSNVLSGVGGFGALYELKNYKNPVLVSGTDGVGTKVLLAHQTGIYTGLGFDLVAMCVDDIVCAGAEPLFFIDYLALGKLEEEIYVTLLNSISEACKKSKCSLIGGETAELPGMYPADEFDLAGFSVGVVEKDEILTPDNVNEGDTVIGIASSGFHSNGFSLVRKVVDDKNLDLQKDYGFGKLGEALLAPTQIYSGILVEALKKFGKSIKGISHITGGGIPGNLNRILPSHLDAVVEKGSWDISELFSFIVETGGISEKESYKVFNMGIGMGLIVDTDKKDSIVDFLNENAYPSYIIGNIQKGDGQVKLV